MTDAPDLFADPAMADDDEPGTSGPIWSVIEADPKLVVRTQPAIWVYENPAGAVVIRMESLDSAEDDSFVFIRPENVDAVVAQMLRVKAELQRQP